MNMSAEECARLQQQNLQQQYAQQSAVFSISPALFAKAIQQLMSPYERDYAAALAELDVEFPGYRGDA